MRRSRIISQLLFSLLLCWAWRWSDRLCHLPNRILMDHLMSNDAERWWLLVSLSFLGWCSPILRVFRWVPHKDKPTMTLGLRASCQLSHLSTCGARNTLSTSLLRWVPHTQSPTMILGLVASWPRSRLSTPGSRNLFATFTVFHLPKSTLLSRSMIPWVRC